MEAVEVRSQRKVFRNIYDIMVYSERLLPGRAISILFLFVFLTIFIAETQSTKIAYKKSISGKPNLIKEKRYKSKLNEEKKLTAKPTKIIGTTPTKRSASSTILSHFNEELETAETAHSLKTSLSAEVKTDHQVEGPSNQLQTEATKESHERNQEIVTTAATLNSNEVEAKNSSNDVEIEKTRVEKEVVVEPTELTPSEETTTNAAEESPNSLEVPAVETTTKSETTTISNKGPVACTCGVFMTSQIKRTGNPYEPPIGKPVIINELDRTFPCNAVGQKQCQTKCLETIVQHLPNSANILCATLDRDIRKERAYLFIKNCRNQWYNTNLAAGREYCCKNGQPYSCPMV